MRFYNREAEIKILNRTAKAAEKASKMTILYGRRRIGKTRLLSEFAQGRKYLYFFVSRKEEALLCAEFLDEIKKLNSINIYGTPQRFSEIFEILLKASFETPLTLIIDEFQEFYRINPAVFSEMQNLWDQYKDNTKLNLIISGSVYALMKKIFENEKEPLFGRANERIHLAAFDTKTVKEIYKEHVTKFQHTDFLAFYIITGGVARYVEHFIDKEAFTFNTMMEEIFQPYSLFLDEGKFSLIEEFGKDYGTYFSILTLIASSKTSRSEIESVLGKNVGGFIDKLENEYSIISRRNPIFSKPGSRNIKFYINDNFLNFWFRFIYKYHSAVESRNFTFLKTVVARDFDTYSGSFLEKYFRQKLIESGKYNIVGQYWDRKGENEIDIICIDDTKMTAHFFEVKRNADRASLQLLKLKASSLADDLSRYKKSFKILSLKEL